MPPRSNTSTQSSQRVRSDGSSEPGGAGSVGEGGGGGHQQRGKPAEQRRESLMIRYQSAACIMAVFTLTLGVLISTPPDGKATYDASAPPPPVVRTPGRKISTPPAPKPVTISGDRSFLNPVYAVLIPVRNVVVTILLLIWEHIFWIGGILFAIYVVREYVLDYYRGDSSQGPKEQGIQSDEQASHDYLDPQGDQKPWGLDGDAGDEADQEVGGNNRPEDEDPPVVIDPNKQEQQPDDPSARPEEQDPRPSPQNEEDVPPEEAQTPGTPSKEPQGDEKALDEPSRTENESEWERKMKNISVAKEILNKVYQALEEKANNAENEKGDEKGQEPPDMENVKLSRDELQEILDDHFGEGKIPQVSEKTALAFENAYLRQKRNDAIINPDNQESKAQSKEKKDDDKDDDSKEVSSTDIMQPLLTSPRGNNAQLDYVSTWDKLELARMMLRIYIKHNDLTANQINQLHALNEDISRKIALVLEIFGNNMDEGASANQSRASNYLAPPNRSQQQTPGGSRSGSAASMSRKNRNLAPDSAVKTRHTKTPSKQQPNEGSQVDKRSFNDGQQANARSGFGRPSQEGADPEKLSQEGPEKEKRPSSKNRSSKNRSQTFPEESSDTEKRYSSKNRPSKNRSEALPEEASDTERKSTSKNKLSKNKSQEFQEEASETEKRSASKSKASKNRSENLPEEESGAEKKSFSRNRSSKNQSEHGNTLAEEGEDAEKKSYADRQSSKARSRSGNLSADASEAEKESLGNRQSSQIRASNGKPSADASETEKKSFSRSNVKSQEEKTSSQNNSASDKKSLPEKQSMQSRSKGERDSFQGKSSTDGTSSIHQDPSATDGNSFGDRQSSHSKSTTNMDNEASATQRKSFGDRQSSNNDSLSGKQQPDNESVGGKPASHKGSNKSSAEFETMMHKASTDPSSKERMSTGNPTSDTSSTVEFKDSRSSVTNWTVDEEKDSKKSSKHRGKKNRQ